MTDIARSIAYHNNRIHIMEKGLHNLNMSLEQRRVMVELKAGQQKKGMQHLGKRLDHAENIMKQIEKDTSYPTYQEIYELLSKQDLSGMDERLIKLQNEAIVQPEFLDGLKSELGEENGTMLFQMVMENLGAELNACNQDYLTLKKHSLNLESECAPIMEEFKQAKEQKNVLDEVQFWSYLNWKNNELSVSIPNVPTVDVLPADGSKAHLERLIAAFETMNNSAKEYKHTEELLTDLETRQSEIEEHLGDYESKVEYAISFYESFLANAKDGGLAANSGDLLSSLKNHKADVSAFSARVGSLEKLMENLVVDRKSEETSSKKLAYQLLMKTAEIREARERAQIIEDLGEIIDNVKIEKSPKLNNQALPSEQISNWMKANGWVMDSELENLFSELEEEERLERANQAKKSVKKSLISKAKKDIEWVEFDHEEIIEATKHRFRAVKTEIPKVEGVSKEDQSNPFSALLRGSIKPDDAKLIGEMVSMNYADAELLEDELDPAKAEKNGKLLEKRKKETDIIVEEILKDYQNSVDDLHIPEVYAAPSADKSVSEYPCMKASQSLSEQICELRFAKKRWESDTDSYTELLAAAEQYEAMEEAFVKDEISPVPRSEIAQYAMEEAKEELLKKAIAYVAAKKRMSVEDLTRMDEAALNSLKSNSNYAGGRRLNAAIKMIHTLKFNPDTKIRLNVEKTLSIFSTKFRESLVFGLKTYKENHNRINEMYKDGYYLENKQRLLLDRQTVGKKFTHWGNIEQNMTETYEKLHQLSLGNKPLTTADWNDAILCAARCYVFHLMTSNPSQYHNIGKKEMNYMAKNLLERSSNPVDSSHNSFFNFVKNSLKTKMDIAAIQRTVEESVLLNIQGSKENINGGIQNTSADNAVTKEDKELRKKIDEIGPILADN